MADVCEQFYEAFGAANISSNSKNELAKPACSACRLRKDKRRKHLKYEVISAGFLKPVAFIAEVLMERKKRLSTIINVEFQITDMTFRRFSCVHSF